MKEITQMKTDMAKIEADMEKVRQGIEDRKLIDARLKNSRFMVYFDSGVNLVKMTEILPGEGLLAPKDFAEAISEFKRPENLMLLPEIIKAAINRLGGDAPCPRP